MSYDKAQNIGELVRKQETNYTTGVTNISKHVQISMIDTLDKIDAYINSKHISGEFDSMGREKPFFNIVIAARNIWYRSTDIDRRHIKIRPTKLSDTTAAFLATVHIQDWMRRENYGLFLNDWGRALATYGSSVVKHVEQADRLIPMVIPWNRLIVDAVDFDGNPKIEVIELTEAQLYERVTTHGYKRDMVQALCQTRQARHTIGGTKKDNLDDYIKLYEVHGNLRLGYLTGKDEDDDKFAQQMHVVSFVEGSAKGQWDDFTLASGREAKDPYMITHLIKEEGQTLSIGSVQHLFEAQWMMNHTVKSIKDQLDLASKLIFQTSDGNFVGQNALASIETGDILIHKVNEPLTQINNSSHDITAQQNNGQMWKAISNELVGISESMLGETAPSGTPWRQVDALLQENHSLFQLMTENKGLHIEEMMRKYVIPFNKKKMDTAKEISATLEAYDITRIDAKHIRKVSVEATNQAIVQAVLRGENVTSERQEATLASARGEATASLSELGSQRFFVPSDLDDRTWKAVFKGLEWELEVDVTAEASNAKDDLTTLSTVFQTIADPTRRAVLSTPDGKMLFNKILSKAGGVSPLELSVNPTPEGNLALPPQAPQPVT